MVQFHAEYIAVGGNRHPSAADWDTVTGLLAYGADKNIALWSPLSDEHRGVRSLLHGHLGHVNAIKFFPVTASQPSMILSGSVDKTIRVWQARQNSNLDFESVATLEYHLGSVNCLAVQKGTNFIASGSADATVKIWRLHTKDSYPIAELIQTIKPTPHLLPLALSLYCLNRDQDFLLAVAGTTSVVQVYVAPKNGTFGHQAILTGHEGWIRSLAIIQETSEPNSEFLLASASQDKYIRLWRISQATQYVQNAHTGLIGAFDKSLKNKTHKLKGSQYSFTITFEALLLGHEDWIYTINWRLNQERLQLLSASADNSLAIWQLEESSGIWVCTARLGEISSQKGSTTATGSTGGFWTGLWSPSGENIVCLGRTGGWRLWNYKKPRTRWAQSIGVSGHTKPVTDIAWSTDGSYLLSTGSDQTTRLHAPWNNAGKRSWHEMARPQIHGYDLNCIRCINHVQFISGADEKLLRVFDEPRATADLLDRLCGVKTEAERQLPETANIPVLGLSNKAIANVDREVPFPHGDYSTEPSVKEMHDFHTRMPDSDHPPFEDQLATHTLWPEREKLYGHGYEISAVAASHDSTVIATSCKASSSEHAVIRLYRTRDWHEVKPSLTAHSLTVTSLCFASDDQYLLSVGRDRQWAVFERHLTRPDSYFLKHSNPKGHSRMILDAAWAPLDVGRAFATAGRDKTVRIWKINETTYDCATTITFSSPVTAVDLLPHTFEHDLVTVSGTEVGQVIFHVLQISDWSIRHTGELEKSLQPSSSILKLVWQPSRGGTPTNTTNGVQQEDRLLAVASDDSSIRIFSVSRIHEL